MVSRRLLLLLRLDAVEKIFGHGLSIGNTGIRYHEDVVGIQCSGERTCYSSCIPLSITFTTRIDATKDTTMITVKIMPRQRDLGSNSLLSGLEK